MLSIRQYLELQELYTDFLRKVNDGLVNPDRLQQMLQEILDSCPTSQTPKWWRLPEQQLMRAQQIWGDITLPPVPLQAVPQTDSEVMLLHVPWSFSALWHNVCGPQGYRTETSEMMTLHKDHLSPNDNNRAWTGPVWLWFDPEHQVGKPSNEVSGQALAGLEVLSALIQFPDWPLSWGNGGSAPNLAGYTYDHFKGDGRRWGHVPCVARWDQSHKLQLLFHWAHQAIEGYASPSVRLC